MKYLEYLRDTNDFLKLKINALLQSDYIYMPIHTKGSLEMVTEKFSDKIFVQAITEDKEIVGLYEKEIKNQEVKLMKVSIDRLIDVVIPELQSKNIDGLMINAKSQVGLTLSIAPKDMIIYKILRDKLKK